jgi:hypothetical protein
LGISNGLDLMERIKEVKQKSEVVLGMDRKFMADKLVAKKSLRLEVIQIS